MDLSVERCKRAVFPQKADEIVTVNRSGFEADDNVCEGKRSESRPDFLNELLRTIPGVGNREVLILEPSGFIRKTTLFLLLTSIPT